MLTFIYDGKLRVVRPLNIRRGKFGDPQIVGENAFTGQVRSFKVDKIVALSPDQERVLHGELESDLFSEDV